MSGGLCCPLGAILGAIQLVASCQGTLAFISSRARIAIRMVTEWGWGREGKRRGKKGERGSRASRRGLHHLHPTALAE